MKPSARAATLIIALFFLFFNGLQFYLVRERLAEAKSKFLFASSAALAATLSDYNKLKALDSAATPTHAWIAYSFDTISKNSLDSTKVTFAAPSLATDTVDPAFIEIIVNSPAFKTIDLQLIDSLYSKALSAKNVHAAYRLDTIVVQGRKFDRQLLQALWMQKRNDDYPYATTPMRLPYYSNHSVFAELKSDPSFFRNDLLWPLLAFAAIILIGNTALLFVYRTIRRQKRINELKTDFINNITHEMKTPITIATAGLEALEHNIPRQERTDFYLHTSKKQLHLLNDFVERILDAAVQDVADLTLQKERLDIHALFSELLQSHAVLPGKKIAFDLHGEGPVYIQGDRLHLQTAFHNIIDNAIKYSNGPVEIDIDIVQNNRDITITIRDNGMGIPPQYLKNVFEKFFRVPQGDAQPVKGFGLGLYYVSSIVKKHSGNITVQSAGGRGTQFIITLPKHA